MDYAALPPEVNSARMYTGPGSGPMLAAALAWDGLYTELSSATADYSSALAAMTSGPWRGPASTSMASAAAPYIAWMAGTATQALQASLQAKAAAAAYETAFAMTVPPPMIAANRALSASLVATNLLGQNTPAIAAAEAAYGEMWAQDAAAMYGYAACCATATQLTPFADPPPTTSPEAGLIAQAATTSSAQSQASLSQVMSTVPTALQGLASPSASGVTITDVAGALGLGAPQLDGIQSWLGLQGIDLTTPSGLLAFFNGTDGSPLGTAVNAMTTNAIGSGFYTPGNFFGTMCDFFGLSSFSAMDAAEDAAIAASSGLGGAAPGLGGFGGLGTAVSAGVGNAASIGSLSVPPTWAATSPVGAAVATLPSVAAGAPLTAHGPASMLGGLPLSGFGGRGFSEVPRYGFKPTVVMHPPAAG
ncbi:PPE family protein [Mycobacterium marinum]|uniref:PPE family protein n=1 Tax=Mycobacterium marinum TaxID=1781 RepID=UPI002340CC82|nr:PPE family protein [Mycobacterium marinum]MDC8997295.1 PPE family protein [Mycobacterium marinum]WDZ15637.1 PPE family protein [Mycobacterium marinum]